LRRLVVVAGLARPPELEERFGAAVAALDRRFGSEPARSADETQEAEVRRWLDGSAPLAWAGRDITPDEWFFITTLYGEMTLEGQRTHIRKFFPLFVELARRDIRNFTPALTADWKLRSSWMKSRLSRMAEILWERDLTMGGYVRHLQELERLASPRSPIPALDAIVADHRATGWKTLSVFVRDCVGSNCFPIDTRVKKELARHGLTLDERNERLLVSLSLAMGRNPRQVNRMFYAAGGE
jgi:hypothetical protein